MKPVLVGLTVAALLSGAAFSWFASTNPDGLEWSMARVSAKREIEGQSASPLHESLTSAQDKTALLPDYALPASDAGDEPNSGRTDATWPAVNAGSSLSGIVGSALVLAAATTIGLILKRRSKKRHTTIASAR